MSRLKGRVWRRRKEKVLLGSRSRGQFRQGLKSQAKSEIEGQVGERLDSAQQEPDLETPSGVQDRARHKQATAEVHTKVRGRVEAGGQI